MNRKGATLEIRRQALETRFLNPHFVIVCPAFVLINLDLVTIIPDLVTIFMFPKVALIFHCASHKSARVCALFSTKKIK